MASTNPVSGAYPTPFEMLPGYLHQYEEQINIAIVVVLLVTVVAVTLVLRKRGRVSLLVFIDEVLLFLIYFVDVWESSKLEPILSTLVCSGFSILTIGIFLPPPPRSPSVRPSSA